MNTTNSEVYMLLHDIVTKKSPLSIIGLGYVGLPIAVTFARKIQVIGFDINSEKIASYKAGVDQTGEVGADELRRSTVKFTSDPADLRTSRFHVVAVPTPVQMDKTPDLSSLKTACVLLGQNLKAGSIVVFESTVFPGVTEDICAPILEKYSGLVCGREFKVGYSPERINPGDRSHRLENIVKIVSGMDEDTLEVVAQVYELVVEAGVYRAQSIRIAEAAKVIENAQRDLNIAFMNELSMIFQKIGIDTLEVLKAAGTKWNFLNFRPGLVGGHCIGVDPYYLTYCAQQAGYNPQLILAGRRINDSMGAYVAESAVKLLAKSGNDVPRCKIAVFGFVFKEDCPDTRNTRVVDIIHELEEYGITPQISDPIADCNELKEQYGFELTPVEKIEISDCLIIAVSHRKYKKLELSRYLKPGGLLIDVKGIFEPEMAKDAGFGYWRL